jgi:hypothetical protein
MGLRVTIEKKRGTSVSTGLPLCVLYLPTYNSL